MARQAPFRIETIARGLHHPWAVALLPGGGFLVTERSGSIRPISDRGAIGDAIDGVPEVVAEDQGGLLDSSSHRTSRKAERSTSPIRSLAHGGEAAPRRPRRDSPRTGKA